MLPRCAPSGLPDIPFTHAFSDCPPGIFHTEATANYIYLPSAGFGINVNFRLDDLWDTGGDARGGDPLWMSLRDRDTNELLMTSYQLDDLLIEDGTVTNELGFGVELVGPVCEGASVGDSVAAHAYELRFSTSNTMVTLRAGRVGNLPASDDSRVLQIQTGALLKGFLSQTSTIIFVAWTDP